MRLINNSHSQVLWEFGFNAPILLWFCLFVFKSVGYLRTLNLILINYLCIRLILLVDVPFSICFLLCNSKFKSMSLIENLMFRFFLSNIN